MKFSYQKGAGFGTVKLGEKTFDARVFLGYAGLIFWLAMLFVTGGAYTWIAIGNIGLYLLLLLVITLPVRSIPLVNLYSIFFYGAFSMGIATFLCKGAHLLAPGVATYTAVPLIETIFFLAPGLIFLWRRRKFSSWELGAADIMLLFAFAGAGFELMELAAIANSAKGSFSGSPLVFMPTVFEGGDRIRGLRILNGQAVWATMAGATIGMASLFRAKPWAVVLALSGAVWVWLDHFAVNLSGYSDSVGLGSSLRSLVNFIVGNGRYTTYLGFASILACIGIDWNLIYRTLPKNQKLTISKYAKPFTRDWLYYILATRRLAFSYYRALTSKGHDRDMAARMFAIGQQRIARYGTKSPAASAASEDKRVVGEKKVSEA